MSFKLPELPYSYDALEPHFDARTMEIHHSKHHNAYVDNLNVAIAGKEEDNQSIEDILAKISTLTPAIRNNGGGHYNHSFFWKSLTPHAGGSPVGKLATAINETFGSVEEFKTKFSDAGKTRFGSGWAWLIVNKEGKLEVCSTPNQDNPLMDIAEVKGTPVIGLDVWEHAYYLLYQNRRPDYINAFWNVLSWETANALYENAIS